MNDSLQQLHDDLRLKPLSPAWAKSEIFLGLACVWQSFHVAAVLTGPAESATNLIASFGLFVLGGYLMLAGSRSHLYQSNNKLTAYLAERIEANRP